MDHEISGISVKDRRLPDFIIIGAMKAGTTSMFQYLTEHPGISRGKRKEPSFFTTFGWEKGVEWYQALFPDNDKLNFEASTNYTKYPTFDKVAQRMHSVIPEVKLIYLVRHPVSRITSQLHHLAVKRNWNVLEVTERFMRENAKQAVANSMYYLQINRFLEYFDRSQILCLTFEDFIKDPARILNQVTQFLGFDSDFFGVDFDYKKHNKLSTSARVKYKRLHTLLHKAHVRNLAPPIHRWLETPVPRPVLTSGAKKYIWNEISADLAQFEKLIGRPLGYEPPE